MRNKMGEITEVFHHDSEQPRHVDNDTGNMFGQLCSHKEKHKTEVEKNRCAARAYELGWNLDLLVL